MVMPTCPSCSHRSSVTAVDHSYLYKYVDIPSKKALLPNISCNIRIMAAPLGYKNILVFDNCICKCHKTCRTIDLIGNIQNKI